MAVAATLVRSDGGGADLRGDVVEPSAAEGSVGRDDGPGAVTGPGAEVEVIARRRRGRPATGHRLTWIGNGRRRWKN